MFTSLKWRKLHLRSQRNLPGEKVPYEGGWYKGTLANSSEMLFVNLQTTKNVRNIKTVCQKRFWRGQNPGANLLCGPSMALSSSNSTFFSMKHLAIAQLVEPAPSGPTTRVSSDGAGQNNLPPKYTMLFRQSVQVMFSYTRIMIDILNDWLKHYNTM